MSVPVHTFIFTTFFNQTILSVHLCQPTPTHNLHMPGLLCLSFPRPHLQTLSWTWMWLFLWEMNRKKKRKKRLVLLLLLLLVLFYTHSYIHTHTRMHTYIHTHTHTHTHTHARMHTHACMHTHTHILSLSLSLYIECTYGPTAHPSFNTQQASIVLHPHRTSYWGGAAETLV